LKIKKRNLIILNEASHLPFFGQLAGRPMTKDGRLATARQAETPNYQLYVYYILISSACWQSGG
jgi:hypothetical protein